MITIYKANPADPELWDDFIKSRNIPSHTKWIIVEDNYYEGPRIETDIKIIHQCTTPAEDNGYSWNEFCEDRVIRACHCKIPDDIQFMYFILTELIVE